MGRVFYDDQDYLSYGVVYMYYKSNKEQFAISIETGRATICYAVTCHERGFETGLQFGGKDHTENLEAAVKAAEDFIISQSGDPMAVIIGRAERRIEYANEMMEYKLNRIHRRAAESNAAQQLEANFMAFALEKSSYKDALRIHNNLIKLHSNE